MNNGKKRTGNSSLKTCARAVFLFKGAHAKQITILLSNRDGVLQHDVHAIHDMRVASRRLRAIIRANRHILKKQAWREAAQQLGEVTRALGKARELDVSLGLLHLYNRGNDRNQNRVLKAFQEHLERERVQSQSITEAAVARINSETFRVGVVELFCEIVPNKDCAIKNGRQSVPDAFRKVLKAYKMWQKENDGEGLHALRVCVKKFRYTCELQSSMFSTEFQTFVESLKQSQEALGDWNDRRVLLGYFDVFAAARTDLDVDACCAIRIRLERGLDSRLKLFRERCEHLFTKQMKHNLEHMLVDSAVSCCKRGQREVN